MTLMRLILIALSLAVPTSAWLSARSQRFHLSTAIMGTQLPGEPSSTFGQGVYERTFWQNVPHINAGTDSSSEDMVKEDPSDKRPVLEKILSLLVRGSDKPKVWPGNRPPTPNPKLLEQSMDASWGRGKFRTEVWDDNVNPLNNWWEAFEPSEEEVEAAAFGFDFTDIPGWCKVSHMPLTGILLMHLCSLSGREQWMAGAV